MTDVPGTLTATAPSRLGRYVPALSLVAFLIVVAGALTEFFAGFGYRMSWLPLRFALQTLLPIGAYIAAAGAGLCVVVAIVAALVRKGGGARSALILCAIGFIVGAAAAYIPYGIRQGAQGVPPIHDISTDTDNPPEFIDARPLRASTGATNPAEYLREVKRQSVTINIPEAQRKAYPDIQPVLLTGVTAADAFTRALAAVDRMGWRLIAAAPEQGRIEASDQTFWFGFIDDVVIRVTPADGGSKIDVRSKSRVGGGDAGTNAKRIRGYIAALEK